MKDLFKALQRKKARREYLKSMLAGILSTVVDFFLTAVFLYFFYHTDYSNLFVVPFSSFEPATSVFIVSTMIAWIAGFVLNYVLCIFFVFQYGNVGKSRLGFVKFLIFGVIGVTLTTILTAIGIAMGFDPWLTKLIVTLIVFVFNFFTRKYFVFNIALIHDEENVIRL
ncbi:MAG: GtrA family protein [Firmicutes bacterium]|nr:GtrA family protein [Bacillota bacterium]